MAIRTWSDVSAVAAAVRVRFPQTSWRPVFRGGLGAPGQAPGERLERKCPGGKPVDSLLIGKLAEFLAGLTQVRKEALPSLPPDWPHNERDSKAFLGSFARLATARLRQANWTELGGLFGVLGVPEDSLVRFAERVPSMARRPYSLLHADLRRSKVIIREGGEGEDPSVVCLDWRSATYGDPLYDLASHLVRMRYPEHQQQEVIDAWVKAVQSVRPMAAYSLSKDLPHYLAFVRIQSVYTDVRRAARSLGAELDRTRLAEAVPEIRGTLERAAEPLRLVKVPADGEIERALYRWQAARVVRLGEARPAEVFRWTPDGRLPECPDFRRPEVDSALAQEGEASAKRVFRGTAHLNTVVKVPGFEPQVVVRRMAGEVLRRERGFLSEHAVLKVIEESKAGVRAPRALALGYDSQDCHFTIHTYEGPTAPDQPPNHPVQGLTPNEADQLVEQLAELACIDHSLLDPAEGQADFYGWLSNELVRLVNDLPEASRREACKRGLPGGKRLSEILGRHRVTPRDPVLLHGDLNPWNLVRDGRRGGLTIIDWEMAMIGDPLYDLVRHLHLTPTLPEIRQRMFRGWSETLPERCTKGWEQDWQVYRWIEQVRSAYIDLDRLVTGDALDTPNVQRAVDAYAMTLAAATASLGLSRPRPRPTP
ncbi:aminoglycoside phosphotransferase family protein [Streptomyces albicerus]|uniref:aminoglycoside phosphotransferase family protein n=1 Tax=Streptomyces albicerus TaxID=2569859 RepID=UPI001CEDA2EA|nr:aminoglycoside phosphotransferase family protein [Streptomyces albicerus]